MTMEQGFPKELLERPTEERISYFEGYITSHPLIHKTYEGVWETMFNKGNYSILYVFGPTGVGKTTLYKKIVEELNKKKQLNMETDKSIIPFIGTRAIAPESGNFDWKDFYIRTLEKMKEPLIGKKVLLTSEDKLKYGAYHNDNSTKAYRKSVESALCYRKTAFFLIDEAQHLTKISSGKKLLNQMDVIKSLAAETDTLIILFGTYGLQKFLNLSDQLSRRGQEFHFPRYRYDNKEELQIFENVLWTFQCHLPLVKEIDLIGNLDFFYERSLGCIGILKDWIDRTYRKAMLSGKEELTIDNFYKSALSVNQCLTIAGEILDGENEQKESETKRLELLNKIGMNEGQSQNSSEEEQAYNKQKKRNKRVGERNPKRDDVGVDKYAQ